MLTYQKNKLINLLLQFEIAFNDTINEIDDNTNRLYATGEFQKASESSYIAETISRNLQSIKKQINKL